MKKETPTESVKPTDTELIDWLEKMATVTTILQRDGHCTLVVSPERGAKVYSLDGCGNLRERLAAAAVMIRAPSVVLATKSANASFNPKESDSVVVTELREALEGLMQLCHEVGAQHADDQCAEYNHCDASPCAWCEKLNAIQQKLLKTVIARAVLKQKHQPETNP